MIFFKHNLITITILVIAISVMPATANYIVIARNYCKILLTTYCGFQDTISDYITSNANADNYSETPGALTYLLQKIFNKFGLWTHDDKIPQNSDSAWNLINKLAIHYLDFIHAKFVQNDALFNVAQNAHAALNAQNAEGAEGVNETFAEVYEGVTTLNGDNAQRFTVAMFKYLAQEGDPDIVHNFEMYKSGTPRIPRIPRILGILNNPYYANYVSQFMKAYQEILFQGDHSIFRFLETSPVEFYCRSFIHNQDNDPFHFFVELIDVIQFNDGGD